MFKRFIAFLLSFLMVFNALPVQALAETIEESAMYEQKLKEELRAAVAEAEYPNGLFDFLTTRMNTTENLNSVEFAVVRKGGTLGKASITLKAIDVTAKYGEDYTITIPNGLFRKTLPRNEDAITLIESISNGDKVLTNESVLTEEEIKAINLNETEVKNAEQTPAVIESDTKEAESITQVKEILEEAPEQLSLKEQREAFFGVKSDRKSWREVEQEEKDSAVDLHKEMYSDIPGVFYKLEFDDGEYIKKVRFNIIDDSISEDEEQVIFAIVDPVGAATGDSLSAFMNIEDNEEKENVEFEIAEKVIFVDKNAEYAEVTVKRTKGLYRYGMINVGTAALTAQPDADYTPVMTELRFVPGQETQKFRVPILNNENNLGLQFIIKLDDESQNLAEGGNHIAVVNIGFKNSLTTTRSGRIQGTRFLSNPGQKIKTLKVSDITDGNYEVINSGAQASLSLTYEWQSKQLYFPGPFTMVERMEIDWINIADKTKEWYWGWINAVYHDQYYSFFRFGENQNTTKQGKFSSEWYSYNLSDNDRKAPYIVVGTYVQGKTKYSQLQVGGVRLYYIPVNIYLKELSDDADRNITPKTWTSQSTSESGDPIDIGKLQFANDSINKTKTFYEGDTAYFAPEWKNGIDNSKVYLWGYKIERKGGLTGDPYYYVKGDSLNVKDLYTNSMVDYKGKKIPWNEVKFDNNTVAILPVFKAKSAYVNISFDPIKGGMAQNSFSNNLTMKIGMLDTVKFNAYENTGYLVTGYEHGDSNYMDKAVTLYADERNLEAMDATYGNSQITNNKSNYRPINDININPAIPGELDFKPEKTFSYLSVQYMIPSMKVKINPRTGDKDKGSILYVPKKGNPQIGNKDTPLVISSIERNKVYTLSGVPNKDYSIKWQDFSGDVNEDGIIDRNESNNIAPYKNLFMRNAVSGNYFGYNVKYGNPLIYYSFWPMTTGGAPGLISGSISLLGGNILDNTNAAGAKDERKPLVGVTLNVNAHDVATDSNGEFSIEDSDFKPGEYYSLTFNYKGINYTGHLNSDVFTEIEVEEYDSFVPYNFSVFEGNKKINPKFIYNKDTIYRFRFDLKTLQPGLSAEKALVRIYSKEGVQKGTPIEVVPVNGSFSFDFNPASNNVVPGDTMTIQFVDQNNIAYLEHNVGFSFFKYLSTFSLLTSFKSPINSAIDMVGALDVAFDLGLSGKVDKYITKTEDEWIIAFGFDKSWEKSLYDSSAVEDEDKPASEELKDAAKSTDDSKTKDTVDKAIETNKKEKTSASLTADMEFGLSTSLYLRMIVDKNTNNAYFKEMILSATVSGKFGTKVEIQTPIGVTVYAAFELGGDITGMMVIEQYDNKKFYFNDDGQIDFSRAGTTDPYRDFTIYGKFIIRPYIMITVGARVPMIDISINGKAQFSMNFTTTGSGSGNVTLSSKLALKVLVFDFNWEVANKTWDLFNYGSASSFKLKGLFASTDYLYINAENYEVSSREYLQNRGSWKGGVSPRMLLRAVGNSAYNEKTLQTGVYPQPYTLLAPIEVDKQLLTFLDDDTQMDALNRTHLYFSTYDGSSWSIPSKVDNDNTPDDNPWLYDMGDKVLVTWSSAVTQVSTSDSAIQVLNNRGLKARFFDKSTKTFGDVIKITDRLGSNNVSDSDPSIAYWKDNANQEHLFITYIKTEYESPTGSDKDTLVGDILNAYSAFAYSFYDFDQNGFKDEEFLDVRDYAKVDESGILIENASIDSENYGWNGYWSKVPTQSAISVSAIAADPLVVDSNAIAYDDFAILAYSIDKDNDLKTTADRMLFIKPYQFSKNKFYPAIYFDDVDEHKDLEFVQANDNVYLFFASKGNVVSIDIGNLFNNNMLYYKVDEKDVFVLNKTKEIYKKPEIVIKHKYETTKDAAGNEITTNESPIDELMVKANNDNIYVMWSEKDITYKEGIDPHSPEAGNPENYYHENHIYAARQIIGEVQKIQLYDGVGENKVALTYPTTDSDGKTIDYTKQYDVNYEVGKVKAGDPVILKLRETEWSESVKLTNEQGANFNDIDFEILSNGNLRAVFVKGKSEVMEVAGQDMSVENINNRTLMTADFNISVNNVEATMQDIPMFKQNELVYFNVDLNNKTLNTLENIKVELYEIVGGNETKIQEITPLRLRGGEEKTISLYYQAPNLLSETKLRVDVKQIVNSNESLLTSVEQNIKLSSSVDILEAKAEFVTRERIKISGSAANNGNIDDEDAIVYANVLGKVAGSSNIGVLKVGEEKLFEFYADVSSSMFESTTDQDGSIVELMKLNINSSGNGASISFERYGSKEDLDVVNNINNFSILTGDYNINDSISIENGSIITITPELTYTDNSLVKPRVVYTSSNESVASIYNYSAIAGNKTGTATITAYALPEKNKMIISENGIDYADNLLTLPEEAIRLKSFNVNVFSYSSDDTSDSTTEVLVPDTDTTVKANTQTDQSGLVKASVTFDQINNSISKALESKNINNGLSKLEIKVAEGKDKIETKIPFAAFKEVSNKSIELLSIETSIAKISLDQKTIAGVANKALEDINIKAAKIESSELPLETQKIVGSRPIYEFKITSGDKAISEFDGYAEVSVEYKPVANEDANSIVIYYIDDNGIPKVVSNCKYDEKTGTITFKTNHFSKFAVGYNNVLFSDVEKDNWYNKAVGFIAARNITTGTSKGIFSPENNLTRSQFLVMVMRAYGINLDDTIADNFQDAGDTYYTNYLSTAKKLGISKGTGNNLFEPEKQITRQEMFVMLYNALSLINQLPEGNEGKMLSDFNDENSVATWAKEPLQAFTKAKVVEGSENKLNPQANATRAEMAQLIYNLLTR